MSELYDLAGGIARDAGRAVLCGLGGLNRITADFNRKNNPLYRKSPLDDVRDRISDGLERFCPLPPGRLPPFPTPPFEGGQCPVPYRLEITGIQQRTDNCSSSTVNFGTGIVFGPITNVRLGASTGPLTCDPAVEGFRQIQATTRDFTNGNLNQTVGSFRWVEILEVQVIRVDGLPDDCGDPLPPLPPGPPPSNPRPPSIDINVDLPDVGPTNVTFAPTVGIIYVDVNNEIQVPVNVRITGPTANIDFNIDFDVNITNPTRPPRPINPRPPRDDDDRPAPPDCPLIPSCRDEPVPERPEDEDEDENEAKDLVLKSVVVLSTRRGGRIRQTELQLGDGSGLFVPYLALVNVVYETEEGQSVTGNDILVKTTRCVIPVPDTGLKAIRAFCRWEGGWEGEVFNVRVPGCECKQT